MKTAAQSHSHKRGVLTSEDYKRQRRDRRMQRTARSESEIRAWAERHRCSVRVLNDGHHWLLEQPGFVAEWWPSSANLAINRDYVHTHHAPHWSDVTAILQKRLATLPDSQAASRFYNATRTV